MDAKLGPPSLRLSSTVVSCIQAIIELAIFDEGRVEPFNFHIGSCSEQPFPLSRATQFQRAIRSGLKTKDPLRVEPSKAGQE